MSELKEPRKSGPAAPVAATHPGRRKKRILLAEDEPLTRLFLLDKLRTAGFDVDVAWNGCLAVEKLRIGRPDALFLDLMLPGLSGVDVIKEARRDSHFGSRPIYVCTSAMLMSMWSRRAFKAGATKVYNKLSQPIDEIVAAVAAHLMEADIPPGPPQTSPSERNEPVVLQEVPAALKESVSGLSRHLQRLAKSNDKEGRVSICNELRPKVHALVGGATDAGMHHMARQASALDAFLKEVCEKPKHVTDSSLRTISCAVEVLDDLSQGHCTSKEEQTPEFSVTVVDDDLVSRTAIGNALRNAGFKPSTFADSAQAIEHLRTHPADIVVLNALVSESSRSNLSKNLRELPNHDKTPVLFVGNPRDVKRAARAPSTSDTEFVVKPFISMELSLKALNLILKNRGPGRAAAPAVPATAAPAPASAPAHANVAAANAVSANAAPANAAPANAAPANAAAANAAAALAAIPDVFKPMAPKRPMAETPILMSDDAVLPEARPRNLPEEEDISAPIDQSALPTGSDVGIVEINDVRKIISADSVCTEIFGWECPELVGQDVEILLKAGLDNDLGRFLQRSNPADQNGQSARFRVVARRKDGTEFSTLVTLERRKDGQQFCWAAAFQALSTGAEAPRPRMTTLPQSSPVGYAQAPAVAEALARLQRSQVALQGANEELQKQFQAISAEAATHREALARTEKEREELVGRIYSNEVEINRARVALERETEERKLAEQKLQEFAATKSELEKQLAQQNHSNEVLLRASTQFREQFENAKAAAQRAETACQEEAARVTRVEEELTRLRQEHETLSGRLTAEQQAVADSRRHSEELERRLRENTDAVERARAEAEKQNGERANLEAQWREQLQTAKAAAAKAEEAWLEEGERSKRLEEELAGLRRVREELNGRLSTEEQAAAEFRQRNEQLENRLRENTTELERVKAELKSHAEERIGVESALREQLNGAKTAAEEAQAALKEEAAQRRRFEEELAGLRQVRDELQGKHTTEQQASADARRNNQELEGRLRESAAALERVKAELNKHVQERNSVEAELREQLNKANAVAEQTEAALREKAARQSQLDEELVSLRQARDELQGKVAGEQQTAVESSRRHEELASQLRENAAELERVRTELNRQTEERAGVESGLREQLNAATAAAERAEAALKEKAADHGQRDQELANLRQERHELHNKFLAEQQAAAKAKRRIKEMENHLRESATGFASVKVELEKRAADRQRLEAGLRAEMEAAKAASQQADAACQEETARCRRLQEELAGLQDARDELNRKLAAEHQASEELKLHIDDLEKRLRESASELGRAKGALEAHASERAGSESDHRDVAGSVHELGMELSRRRENEAAQAAELSELERRIRDGVASLTRVTADLEKERGERRRIEQRAAALASQLQELHGVLQQHLESEKATQGRISDLELQVREREDAITRVGKELQKEAADRQLAEEHLKAVGDMSGQLRKYLSLFEESKKVFKRAQDDLEVRLQNSLAAASENESKAQKEASERQRLEEALAAAQRNLNEQSQRSEIELSRLQAELQVEQFERKRLEGDAVQSRYASLDSARVGRALVNSLCREIRQPVDNLMQFTRRLLEVELPDEHKKLVESVLENALLLQTSLQETGTLPSSTVQPGGEGQPNRAESRPADLPADQPAGQLQP